MNPTPHAVRICTLPLVSACARAACALLVFATAAAAQSAEQLHQNTHAKIDLIAERLPSHHIQAGVRFQLDPGWHIYWQNAGDSGEPPKIQWSLPAGFKTQAIQWPTPKRLGSGSIIDYGYENEVLLITPIEVPPESAAQNLQIAADVKYVVCREICIPGKSHLALALPSGNSAQAGEWRALFEKAEKQIPKPPPRAWKLSAKAAQNNLTLTIQSAPAPKSAVFLPQNANIIENSAPQVLATEPGGFHLNLKASDQATRPPTQLRGVLVLDGDRAYQITARVNSKEQPSSK